MNNLKSPFGWSKVQLFQQLKKTRQKSRMVLFERMSKAHEVDLYVLLGIASRETNMCNIIGDSGHGRGIMQIDDRFHAEWLKTHEGGMDVESNIDYGAGILKANIEHFNGDMQKAVAAYNCGIHNVEVAVGNDHGVDAHTTKGNYSADVLARAKAFRELINNLP